jgi:hypothetical protein
MAVFLVGICIVIAILTLSGNKKTNNGGKMSEFNGYNTKDY